ncbi:MAG: methyltransferase [Nanoarchaeota archaeon]|nr:methyltransferase [Nanoarchaeota archaeon]
MIIKFNDELTKQEIYANGDELARIMGQDKDEKGKRTYTHAKEKKEHIITFENPILMTDNHKISQLEPAKRDTLFALYGSHTKITEYDGVSLEFEQRKYLGVWGPSIDTMLFCKALKNEDLTNVKTAVEVGFGSGFISKYLLSKAPNLEEMTMIDLNPNTRECAETNIDDKRAKILIGDAQKLLKGKKYDLIVCNPPYIPRPKSIDDNAYEGVGLLHYLIKNAKELLTEKGTLITNISNLCEDIALQTIEESKANMNKLTSLEVPLKVYNVLNNPEWMKYLLEEKGLKQERKNGYDYWQAIEIMKIKTTKEKKKKTE